MATVPRGASQTATLAPSRSEAPAHDQSRGDTPSLFVFVLDWQQCPLMPCHPARARQLLKAGRAVIHRLVPFTIRLTDRTVGATQPIALTLDPGSKTTGLALSRWANGTRIALWLAELTYREAQIRKKLQQRAGYRRRRRSANFRHRAPRFQNRRRPEGWLPPSLQHRVHTTMSWVTRLQRWAPITQVAVELVKFDTQALQNPEITVHEYQQGTLFGYEVREYLLEKWGRQCTYCDATNSLLQIDHIRARSQKGGSDRISNLTLACQLCNQQKGNRTIREFLVDQPERLKRILARSQEPLHEAAAVNSTRWTLVKRLQETGLPIETGTGGRTKWNRSRLGLPKTHALDALCVGTVESVRRWAMAPLQITATGRGAYQRTRVNAAGFSRGYMTRQKTVKGFRTGDLARAVVPTGKKTGVYTGRVAVRASGSFNLQTRTKTIQGLHARHCRILMRADGYAYHLFHSRKDAPPPRPHGRGLRRERN